MELATPGSAVRHASVARHVTDCATRPGWSFETYISHCLIKFNISRKKNDFGLNSFQKMKFSKKNSHLNALESKFDLEVK